MTDRFYPGSQNQPCAQPSCSIFQVTPLGVLVSSVMNDTKYHRPSKSDQECERYTDRISWNFHSFMTKCLTIMARLALSPKDYTVAWICALSIELAAAQNMLDEEHNGVPTAPSDHNSYTLGRVNDHNVVIANLPLGYIDTCNQTDHRL